MEDSQASGQQTRHRIVVPSRTDPTLRTMTEPVGGPLGRRTAPGITDPGFFTVERVLIFMAMVSALIAVMAKYHCRQSGWTTPDQYSTVCWSEFPNSFVQHNLGSVFPFLSSGSTFDQLPLAGFIAGITAWLTGGAGHGALRQLAFFDVNAALIAAVWIFTVVVVARTARRRPWDAAIVAASPLLWLTAFVSWDFWAAGLVALGIYLFARRRTIWAGFVLGLAAMVAPYAILVLVALVLLGVRAKAVTKMLEALAAGAVGWLLVLLPVMLSDAAGWKAYVDGAINGPASDSSIYGGYNLIAGRMGLPEMSTVSVNTLSAVLLMLVVLGVAAIALYAPRQPRVAQLAFVAVAGFVVVNKTTEPWQAVWLLPLLALALPRWRPVLLWQAAVITHFIALMLFQSKQLGNISPQHAIDTPYFVMASALAGVATCALLALTVRDIWRPHYDVVRRGGVDDPQGGVLLATAPRMGESDVVTGAPDAGEPGLAEHPKHA